MNRAIDEVLENPLPGAPRPLAFSVIRVRKSHRLATGPLQYSLHVTHTNSFFFNGIICGSGASTAFFLEPQFDEEKEYEMTNRERLVKKWGGKRGWEEQKLRHDLKGRGQEAGIPHFNLDRKAANSMASHRLIQHIGKTYGLAVSEAIYDKLNEYYFVEGHSLNNRPLLAKTVSTELQSLLKDESVPTEQQLLDFLNGNEGREEIEAALHGLRQLGVHGIPKFIISGSMIVDGAARSDVFVR